MKRSNRQNYLHPGERIWSEQPYHEPVPGYQELDCLRPTAAFGYDLLRRIGRNPELYEIPGPEDPGESGSDPDNPESE
jgi:hypothetical protein